MKFEFPPPDAPASGGGNDDIVATGGFAAWSHSDRWATLPNVEDWRGYGGDPSDTGTLLAAIAAAEAAGGMRLRVPAHYYSLEQTLLIGSPHVVLIGDGSGAGHIESGTELGARTSLEWDGDVGGTMLRISTPEGEHRLIGCGIQGIRLNGNDARAARGLVLESLESATFRDLFVWACSESHIRTAVVDYALATPVADLQRCVFEDCIISSRGKNTAPYLESTAIGFHLTGGSPTHTGNTSGNSFFSCHAFMSKGIGLKMENTDDNFFYWYNGGAIYDSSVYGIELGSSTQDSTSGPITAINTLGPSAARFNMFYGTGARVHCRAGQTGAGSSNGNMFFGLSRANAWPPPTMEEPAGGSLPPTVFYHDTHGFSRMSAVGLTELRPLEDVFAVEGVAQLYIDGEAGPLKRMDSAGNVRQVVVTTPDMDWHDQSPVIYSRFLDGIGTPDVQLGEPVAVFSDDFSAGLGSWTSNGVAPVFEAAPWGGGDSCIKCVVDDSVGSPSSYLSRAISLDLGRVVEFDVYWPVVEDLSPTSSLKRVYIGQLRSGGAYYQFGVNIRPTRCEFFISYSETPLGTTHLFTFPPDLVANTKYRLRFEMYQGFSADVLGRMRLYIDDVLIGEAHPALDHAQSAIATLYIGASGSNVGAPVTVYLGNLTVSEFSVDSLAARLTGNVGGIDFVGGWAVGGESTTESGTWTPAFSFLTPGDSVITHTVQVGKYLKIGNFVFLMLDLEFNTNAYTTAAGAAQITGLPFAGSALEGALPGTMSMATFTTAQELRLSVPSSGTTIFVRIMATNVAIVNAGVTVFPASKTGIRIKASGIYFTASAAELLRGALEERLDDAKPAPKRKRKASALQ